MASASVIFLLFGITIVCGVPLNVANEADEIEKLDQNLKRSERQNNGFQLPQTVDSPDSAVDISEGRTKFPPAADAVHNLLEEIKKSIPLVAPLKLGFYKPDAYVKPKPVECHHPSQSQIFPGLIHTLGNQLYQPLPGFVRYAAPGTDGQVQPAHPPGFPTQIQTNPKGPISWESIISEEPKEHTHFTTLPYIHGYKMTPLYSEKQIIVKDYADPSKVYSSVPYPQPQVQEQQQQEERQENEGLMLARSADNMQFLSPELQKPYGLNFVMENDPQAGTPEFQQSYGMLPEGFLSDGSALSYA